MAEFARRTHHTTVTLDPGETKLFRLPPMTPGPIVIDAKVVPAPPPGGGMPPPGGPPTDLKMELIYGGQVVATHGSHILHTTATEDDTRKLRLTRKPGGSAPRTYTIEANYPSALPIIERRILPSAFQDAFDANWNQHPYISVEATPDYHVRITYDEQFRLLYGLDNLDIDMGIPSVVPNMAPITTKDVRFTIGHDLSPLRSGGASPFQVPVVDLMVNMKVGDSGTSWLLVRFYLMALGFRAGYIPYATGALVKAIANVPTITEEEVRGKIEGPISDFGQARFGIGFTPWLCGEPGRELFDLRYDTASDQIVVKFIGSRPPPPSDPVIGDDPEPPDTTPRLFDTPDELPLPPPPIIIEPGGPYTTSAGALASINNIVVVMQENRSFDQVLGYLSRELGRSEVRGLAPGESPTQLNRFNGGDGERIYRPDRAPETKWFSFDAPGPCHDHECVVSQMTDDMGHFVSNYFKRVGNDRARLQRIMDYFTADQLPAFAALARDFAICDAWHCAHVGPTWPNRFITLTGDLNRDRQGEIELNQPALGTLTPLTAKTLFDHLSERDVGWRLYEHGFSFLRLYGRYTFDTQNVRSYRDATTGFAATARAGRLPPVTFIEPDYIDLPPGNDDHPPGDMADGQRFIADIVSALMESPQWDRTLLIITYDEHGGFYDHVVPPAAPPLTGNFTQLGPRVPTFVVSPWVDAGAVTHTTFDHTSIAATILRRFCSPHPPRLSPRADAAKDLRELIQARPRPRADFEKLHSKLVSLRDRPAPAPQKPKKLAPWTEADDFHSLLAYVRSFT